MEQHRYRAIGDGFFSFTRNEIFLKLILLFPLFTLFQHHIDVLNKLLFLLVLMVLFFVSAVQKKNLAYLGVIGALWLVSLAVTPLEAFRCNLNMTFYYMFLVLYLVYILGNQKAVWKLLVKNRRYIFYTVLLYTAVVTLSIFLPSSYSQSSVGGWGDAEYFTSISGSPNRVGPASVFVMVLLIFLVVTSSHKAVTLLAVPNLYVFLMGGSRTYFVVGICTAVVLCYVLFPRKKWFFLSLIPLGLVAIPIVLSSSMMDKFIATFTTATDPVVFWQKLTNTRSIFWVEQLKLFFATPLWKQFFGNGINFTTHQYGLWAHSDFIEILCSYGYLGLANYIGLMLYTLKTFLKTEKRHFFIKCVVVFIWFFNAFINFFYCYFCAMLCYPILLLVIQNMDHPAED